MHLKYYIEMEKTSQSLGRVTVLLAGPYRRELDAMADFARAVRLARVQDPSTRGAAFRVIRRKPLITDTVRFTKAQLADVETKAA